MTSQRRLILETLMECSDHPTAEEIFARALKKNPALNLSTVYRTLRWLEQQGLVNTRRFDGERRLERFDPVVEKGENHYHFRCRQCNQIIEFDSPLLELVKTHFQDCFGGEVQTASLVFYGVCSECREKSNTV
ncbi:MAG: transcriptional repressor [Chloroflexota bacterium]